LTGPSRGRILAQRDAAESTTPCAGKGAIDTRETVVENLGRFNVRAAAAPRMEGEKAW
jgi:hypothetical protein